MATIVGVGAVVDAIGVVAAVVVVVVAATAVVRAIVDEPTGRS